MKIKTIHVERTTITGNLMYEDREEAVTRLKKNKYTIISNYVKDVDFSFHIVGEKVIHE